MKEKLKNKEQIEALLEKNFFLLCAALDIFAITEFYLDGYGCVYHLEKKLEDFLLSKYDEFGLKQMPNPYVKGMDLTIYYLQRDFLLHLKHSAWKNDRHLEWRQGAALKLLTEMISNNYQNSNVITLKNFKNGEMFLESKLEGR